MRYTKIDPKYRLYEGITLQTALIGFGYIATDHIALSNDGLMVLTGGFEWDGPSGPCPDLEMLMTPSAFHDAGYRLLRQGLLPPEARQIIDDEFGRLARERGSDVIADLVEEAVERLGVQYAARQEEEIFEVP